MKLLRTKGFVFTFSTLILLVGYQNCGELSSRSAPPGNSETLLSGNENNLVLNPALISDLTALGYAEPDGCADNAIAPLQVYNPSTNLCATAQNACEAFFLLENGYSEDQSEEACQNAENPLSSAFKTTMTDFELSTVDFKPDANQICSQNFAVMVNFSSRECAQGRNGCEINFLQDRGFIVDSMSVCEF